MLERLLDRFDHDYLRRRMHLQVDLVTRLLGAGVGPVHLENVDALFPLIRLGLKAARLWERGVINTMDLVTRRHVVELPGLPRAFRGLRVLHLSDVHIDVDPRYGPGPAGSVPDAVSHLPFDLCVITGDFRFSTHGRYDLVHEEMRRLMPSLACELGVYGILGNHDFIEQALYLEAIGIRMLVNESVALERGGERLWLVGLDDPHFYGTHSFESAYRGVPEGAPSVLMVHSPELGEEAAARGAGLYLCGHTHGGQLCLPGGFAPYVNARCPRERIVGRWRVGRMEAYTSAGTGSSGLPVRLNQPPEIAILELR